MAIRKHLALLASTSCTQGPVFMQLTLAIADFFILVKMANKNSGSQFSDQEVNNLICYYQSETDLWLINSPKCHNSTCLNQRGKIYPIARVCIRVTLKMLWKLKEKLFSVQIVLKKKCIQEITVKEVLCQGRLHSHCHIQSERAMGLLIWERSILTLDPTARSWWWAAYFSETVVSTCQDYFQL